MWAVTDMYTCNDGHFDSLLINCMERLKSGCDINEVLFVSFSQVRVVDIILILYLYLCISVSILSMNIYIYVWFSLST